MSIHVDGHRNQVHRNTGLTRDIESDMATRCTATLASRLTLLYAQCETSPVASVRTGKKDVLKGRLYAWTQRNQVQRITGLTRRAELALSHGKDRAHEVQGWRLYA